MLARKIVSERIEYLRTQILQISQSEFAEKLHLQTANPRSTVNNWETGDVQIKSDILTLIAKTFNVSTDWLLGLRDENNLTLNEDIAAVAAYTGLTDRAIVSLHNSVTCPPVIRNQQYIPATISHILESQGNGLFLLCTLAEYLEIAPPVKRDLIEHLENKAVVTIRDFDTDAFNMVQIQNLLFEIKADNHAVYSALYDDEGNIIEEKSRGDEH